MKNVFKLIGIVALVAAIGVSFAACDDGNGGSTGGTPTGGGGGGSSANVVGTWKGTYTEKISGLDLPTEMTWVFGADRTWSGSTVTFGMTITAVGTYTVSGNTVTITNTTHGATDTATVSGNTMTAPVRNGTGGPQIDTVTLRKSN